MPTLFISNYYCDISSCLAIIYSPTGTVFVQTGNWKWQAGNWSHNALFWRLKVKVCLHSEVRRTSLQSCELAKISFPVFTHLLLGDANIAQVGLVGLVGLLGEHPVAAERLAEHRLEQEVGLLRVVHHHHEERHHHNQTAGNQRLPLWIERDVFRIAGCDNRFAGFPKSIIP